MEKKRVLTALFTLAIVAGILAFASSGRKPFRDLEASDIVSATVFVGPPDTTIPITAVEELVAHLKQAVLYHEDNAYTKYDGQTVLFTLHMADGSQMKITAFNPFMVIDGVGYRTAYQPCEALNQYANRLLDERAERVGAA